MKHKVTWAPLAEFDYAENLNYLSRKWTVADARNFIHKVDEAIELLSSRTVTFKESKFKNIFQFPIVPQITLFYRIVDEQEIELVRFWNNYKDPKNFSV